VDAQTVAIWAAAIASASGIASPIVSVAIARRSSETALETARLAKESGDADRQAAKETADANRELERERFLADKNRAAAEAIEKEQRALYVSMADAIEKWLLGVAYADGGRTVDGYAQLVTLGPRQVLYGSQAIQNAGESLIRWWQSIIQTAHDTGVEPPQEQVVREALDHARVVRNAIRTELGLNPLAFRDVPPPPMDTGQLPEDVAVEAGP
jgi:hypothetical protein